MVDVIFYTKDNCPLCDEALLQLSMLRNDYSFDIEKRDIYSNDDWLLKYQVLIPVVEVNNEQLTCEEISFKALEQLLKKASKHNKVK